MENKKYYIVNTKQLANTIHYLTGLTYFAYENKKDSSKQVYSFEDTPQFRNALSLINDLRNELRNTCK